MSGVLRYALLGVGPAGIYALAAQGIVLIHRGSGVLNFAQGAFALLGASLFVELWVDEGITWEVAALVALIVTAGEALVVFVVVIAPLRVRSPLVRLIATLGVLAVVQQGVVLAFGGSARLVPRFLPEGVLSVSSDVAVGVDRMTILAIACVVTVVLTVVFRFTRFGFATEASAENHVALASLGHSPRLLGAANWTLGGLLAGAAGILVVPISGLAPIPLTLMILPAFAAALVGGLRSFPLTLVGAIGLGIGQSLVVGYVSVPGWSEALPFLVIVAVVSLRGGVLPGRGEDAASLPRVARRTRGLWACACAVAVVSVAIVTGSNDLRAALVSLLIVAVLLESLVLLTGFAGQISLGQYALAGVGAWAAAQLGDAWALPFIPSLGVGVAAAAIAGLAFAIPAVRTRGVSLALVTLGLGIAIQQIVFTNPDYIGGFGGTILRSPAVFGVDLSFVAHPRRYALLVGLALAAVILLVENVRAGAIGRRLIAVRSSERAASALGINVARAKAYTFAIAAAIAGLAGVLLAYRGSTVPYAAFELSASTNLVSLVTIAGLGYAVSGVTGAFLAPGALTAFLWAGDDELARYVLLVTGALLILVLIVAPDGINDRIARARDRVARRGRVDRRPPPVPAEGRQRSGTPQARSVPPTQRTARPALDAEALTVHHGGLIALDAVSLSIRPEQIVGLIGPNGAGKTTLIDALSGQQQIATGAVRLGERDVTRMPAHRRARLGLGRTFQGGELFDDLTVRETLVLASERMAPHGWVTGLVVRQRLQVADDIYELAESLGIAEHLDERPPELPFGVRRLVGVARAVASGASIVLLDEPAAGLSDAETRALGDTLRTLVSHHRVGILLVDHDVRFVVETSDDVVALDLGRVIYHGAAAVVLDDADVRSSYLGVGASA